VSGTASASSKTTCDIALKHVFLKIEFMAKSGFEIAPNFFPIHLISRIYPKRISVNMHSADTIDTAEKAMALIGSV
jgi:hypothetical protein